MGKVNVWLKRSYICTIGVIAVSVFYLLTFFFFLTICIIRLSGVSIFYFIIWILIYLECEKQWALIAFAVGMILGCLFFILIEISFPFMERELKNNYLSMLPLSNVSENNNIFFSLLSSQLHCCGITSLGDWENNIPESCKCDIDSSDDCVSVCLSQVLL
uniref:Uncharacterized protein n=1 Tax=Poecilia reticulata TaxID=8081 RepID=A0A3P9P5B8_POERE